MLRSELAASEAAECDARKVRHVDLVELNDEMFVAERFSGAQGKSRMDVRTGPTALRPCGATSRGRASRWWAPSPGPKGSSTLESCSTGPTRPRRSRHRPRPRPHLRRCTSRSPPRPRSRCPLQLQGHPLDACKKKQRAFKGLRSTPTLKTHKKEIFTKGLSVIKSGKYEYPITAQLIKDGRKNKILSKKIRTKIKVTMVHGGKDEVVPVSFSRKVLSVFPNAQKKLVVIKNGDHSLSNQAPLKKIIKELNNIVKDII